MRDWQNGKKHWLSQTVTWYSSYMIKSPGESKCLSIADTDLFLGIIMISAKVVSFENKLSVNKWMMGLMSAQLVLLTGRRHWTKRSQISWLPTAKNFNRNIFLPQNKELIPWVISLGEEMVCSEGQWQMWILWAGLEMLPHAKNELSCLDVGPFPLPPQSSKA